MNFEWTEGEELLLGNTKRFFEKQYSFQARKALIQSGGDYCRTMWPAYAELGLTGIGLGEGLNGNGEIDGAVYLVANQMGRALALEPFIPTVVLGIYALKTLDVDGSHAALLQDVADGKVILGWVDNKQTPTRSNDQIVAISKNGSWSLSGFSKLVPYGDLADKLLVVAKSGGEEALFMVGSKADGVRRERRYLQNATPAAEITFDNATAIQLGAASVARKIIGTLRARAGAAICANAVGLMEGVLSATIAYVKTRVAFGRPLSQNQAVQHRVAEMYIALEKSRSLALASHAIAHSENVNSGALDLAKARLIIGKSARLIAQQGIQLHGALGMTEECNVGHYLRHQLVLEQLYGDTEYHIDCLVKEEERLLGVRHNERVH